MNTQSRHLPLIILITALLLTTCMVLCTERVEAKQAQMKMPVKISGDGTTLKLKYNSKGDLIQYDDCYTLSYTYKNGVKNTAILTITDDTDDAVPCEYKLTFDSKGRIKKCVCIKGDEEVLGNTYSFSYKKNSWSIKYRVCEYDDVYDTGKETYKLINKNGKLARCKIYDNGKLVRTRTYYSNGLIKSEKGKRSWPFKCKYVMKGKYVQKLRLKDGEGHTHTFTFKYGNAKANASRYYKVINEDERCLTGFVGHRLLEGDHYGDVGPQASANYGD